MRKGSKTFRLFAVRVWTTARKFASGCISAGSTTMAIKTAIRIFTSKFFTTLACTFCALRSISASFTTMAKEASFGVFTSRFVTTSARTSWNLTNTCICFMTLSTKLKTTAISTAFVFNFPASLANKFRHFSISIGLI